MSDCGGLEGVSLSLNITFVARGGQQVAFSHFPNAFLKAPRIELKGSYM